MFSGHKAVLGENYEDTFDITVKAEDFKFGIERTLSEQTGSARRAVVFGGEKHKYAG